MSATDPRWLEILKASGWQTTALAIGCAIIAVLVKREIIPTDGNSYWISIPIAGAVVFGCLALASILDTANQFFNPLVGIKRWQRIRKEKREVEQFIPYMSKKDREIIAYLLHHNRKMFQAENDGGYAAPLIARGIIRTCGVHGQIMDLTRVPFEIPDHIWSVLEANRDEFPHRPPPAKGETETHPWAIPWMAR